MSPLAAVAFTAAGIGLTIATIRGVQTFIRWTDRRMERLLADAFNYSLDDELRALMEEDA